MGTIDPARPHVEPSSPAAPSHPAVTAVIEITDTVALPYTTGLQRVARELVSRLAADPDRSAVGAATDADADAAIRYRPTVWSVGADWYRDLTPDESDRLTHPGSTMPASNASQTMTTQRRARAAGARITRPNCRDTAGVLISIHYPVSGA